MLSTSNQPTNKMIKINQMNGENMIIKYSQYVYNLKRNIANTYNKLYTSIELYREGGEFKLKSNDTVKEDDKIFFIENKEMDYLEELQEGTLDRLKYMIKIYKKTSRFFNGGEPYFYDLHDDNRYNHTLHQQINTAFGFFHLFNGGKVNYESHNPLKEPTYYTDKYDIQRQQYKTPYYKANYRDYKDDFIKEDPINTINIIGMTPKISKTGRYTYEGLNKKMLLEMVKMNGITKGLSKKTIKDLMTILLKV